MHDVRALVVDNEEMPSGARKAKGSQRHSATDASGTARDPLAAADRIAHYNLGIAADDRGTTASGRRELGAAGEEGRTCASAAWFARLGGQARNSVRECSEGMQRSMNGSRQKPGVASYDQIGDAS